MLNLIARNLNKYEKICKMYFFLFIKNLVLYNYLIKRCLFIINFLKKFLHIIENFKIFIINF